LITQPPSGWRSAVPLGSTVDGAMKSPTEKISSCTRSGNTVPANTACTAPRQNIQPVDGQPRASVRTTRKNVSTPNS
jgi:hypothetical protein